MLRCIFNRMEIPITALFSHSKTLRGYWALLAGVGGENAKTLSRKVVIPGGWLLLFGFRLLLVGLRSLLTDPNACSLI
jgi:hypothetical protein